MTPDRDRVVSWLRAGLDAVDPDNLTQTALHEVDGPLRVLAIGKAAPAMCRGAAAALGSVSGLCISNHEASVPDGVELIVGDHPIPGPNSLAAGARARDFAPEADVALISGGGSALCEVPAAGVTLDYVASVTDRLLDQGVPIDEANVLRTHLSALKGGGLGPIPTFVLSDVCGHGPGVVASGPTIPLDPHPESALSTLRALDIDVPADVERAIREWNRPGEMPSVHIVGDGHTAAAAVGTAAMSAGEPVDFIDTWVTGPLEAAVARFISDSRPGVTVAAGEASLPISGGGRGGRNTHAALLAATRIAGSRWLFAALATDGVDGNSVAAGAVVDGGTLQKGGDAAMALAGFDSASYLARSGDLIETGPTGTNVADLWLIWKPED